MPGSRSRRLSAAAAITVVALAASIAAVLPAAAGQGAAATASVSHDDAPAARAYSPPPIRHVWIIDLGNESFGYTFGAEGRAQAPYLAKTLPADGALLVNYYGIGHDSLDNYIAQISGQAPDYQTGQDCEYFEQFIQFGGENFDKWTKYGQLSGDGCVYPRYVTTIASQLTAKGLTWKSYDQNMGNDPRRDGTTRTRRGPACGHPRLNHVDLTDITGPPPRRRTTPSSPRIPALTPMTSRGARTARRAGCRRQTGSWRSGSRGSPARRPTGRAGSSW